jgi:hypothetical protein
VDDQVVVTIADDVDSAGRRIQLEAVGVGSSELVAHYGDIESTAATAVFPITVRAR